MKEPGVDNPPSREGEVAALREAVAQLGIALQSLFAKETRSLEMAIVSNLPEPEDPVEQKTEDAQSAPPWPDIDLREFYITGLQAKADGDLDRAAMLWQQILDRNESYLNGLVDKEMQQLQALLRPIHIRRYLDEAERARAEGAWQQEVASLEALIRLEPQNAVWARRKKYAVQNRDNSELYEIARELAVREAKTQARDHLEMLWNNAPAFGDPANLGAEVGFTYEDFQREVEKHAQDAKKELEEAQLQLATAEAERMSSLIAWEKQTRRKRFRRDILGDRYLTVVLSYAFFFACLVIALCMLAHQVSFLSDAHLPFHVSQLIFVAVLVVPAGIVLYFVVFSPTLSIVAFLAMIVLSLGLGELLLQVNWSVANPALHIFTLPFSGRSAVSLSTIVLLLVVSALSGAIAALIAGLLIGVGLRVLKIRHEMKSSIGLSLLYSVMVVVSYIIVANTIGATLGYTVAGLVIGIITALAVVVLRVKDADTTFFLIILPTGVVLSLYIRFVESLLFGLSDLSANWLAISLIYALLFGYGAGKIFRSSALAVRYLQRLRHWRREGFEALALFVEARGALPSKLSQAQMELLKGAMVPVEKD